MRLVDSDIVTLSVKPDQLFGFGSEKKSKAAEKISLKGAEQPL